MPEMTESSGLPESSQQIPEPSHDGQALSPDAASPPLHQDISVASPVTADEWVSVDFRSGSQKYTTRRRLPVSLWLTALLLPYAIVSTIGMAYLFQQRIRSKEPHILESIPDQGLYEDFLDGRRREVIQTIEKAGNTPASTKIIPPNEPLGQDIPALKVGETRRIGQLEITPKSISKQQIHFAWRGGKPNLLGEEGLLLQIDVKNVGPYIFRPDDETFNRSFANSSKSPVYTFLEAGGDNYYGVIDDPLNERMSLPACATLQPGETGIISVVASRNSDGKKQVVNAMKTGETFLWHVQIRRGKEEITLTTGKKRSVWLTTVVPISFTKAEIK